MFAVCTVRCEGVAERKCGNYRSGFYRSFTALRWAKTRVLKQTRACFHYRPPPHLLRCEPIFERKNACKTQENCVSAPGGGVCRHSKNPCAIVN